MRSSAQALEIIRDHVTRNGTRLRLGQVVPKGGDSDAGVGVDRVTEVTVSKDRHGTKLDPRVFPGGVLTGTLACRAVLLEPDAAAHPLLIGSRADGAFHLRTRLEYEEPRPDSLPDRSTALSSGGTVMQVAVHNLLPGDGERLDEYYARVAAYGAALVNGDPLPDSSPMMPDLNTVYELPQIPGVPTYDKRVSLRVNDNERLRQRRLGFEALQLEYPAAGVLSISTQGYISENELMDWAVALTSEAA